MTTMSRTPILKKLSGSLIVLTMADGADIFKWRMTGTFC